MKKVTAFLSSSRRKATFRAVQEFERILKEFKNIDFEYVFLSDYHLEYCEGCKLCFDKGEEHCSLSDDRDLLLKKMEESDGVIFACPNYAFHVPARMKNLLDRMAFCFHRPRFFGKTFTSVVTQGVCGGRTVRKYLESSAKDFGFSTTRGCCMTTLEPLTERQEKDLKRKTRKAAERFYHELCQPAKAPSVFRLMMFRVARMRVKRISKTFYDYGYYEKQGCGSHPITISTSLWGQERKPWGNFSTS